MKAQLINVNHKPALADAIGSAKAAIAKAQEHYDALVELAKDAGYDTLEGELFDVAITYGMTRKTVAWAKIAKDLGASKQRIAANTKTSDPFDKVTISAKKEAQ